MSLRFGILGLLDFCPMTGYNLKKVFDKSINNVWTANLSQIYRELSTLEKDGCVASQIVEQDDRPDKRIYQITEKGEEMFLEWMGQCPENFISPKRDEFMLKILFGASLGKDKVKEYLERFIEDRKKAVTALRDDKKNYAALAGQYGSEMLKKMMKDERYIRFVIRRAVLTNEFLIQWAQECINELNEDSHS